jgi:hypothetical protein
LEKPRNPLVREVELRNHTLAALLSAAATGVVTLLPSQALPWVQWTWLAHVFLGIVLTLCLAGYLGWHVKRAFGLRRPWASLAGGTVMLVFLGVIATGLHISLLGQMEAKRWVYDWHVILSIACVVGFAVHAIIGNGFARTQTRSESSAVEYARAWKLSTLYGFSVALVIALASGAYGLVQPAENNQAAVTPYQMSYGPHPFRPSQTETSTGTFIEAARLGNSAQCGACHAQITQEWQASIHSQAASDKTYQKNVNLLAKKKGMATTRYCEGCHAPIPLLSGQLTEGGKLDTPGHMLEGVGCLGCHGISEAVHVKGVASFRLTPPGDYLFARNSNYLALKTHNFILSIQPKQHRKDMAREVLSSPQLCATCHVQFMDKDVNQWGWVQMQDEYTAWLNSPYSKQTRQTFAEGSLQRCQDCHFPLAKGIDPSANGQGMIRSHFSLGSNTAIPYLNDDHGQLSRTKAFLQTDKVRVDIDIPERSAAVHSTAHIAPGLVKSTEVPDYVYLNETLHFNIAVANTQVGHNFPGGTTDINEVWLYIRIADAEGKTVFESGALDDKFEVDKNAYFYKSIPIDREGNPVWRHDLFNMTGDGFKRVIAAGKSDIVPYQVDIPDWVKSPLTISAALKYRKFNNQYARWALEDENIQLPIVDLSTDLASIPTRLKPEIESFPTN